jgi:hypothetical protein
MRHFETGRVWLQVIVDPAGENRGFHRRHPRLRKRCHPAVQIGTRGVERAFALHVAADVFDAELIVFL